MSKRYIFLTWLIVTLVCRPVHSQSSLQIRKDFYEAESWILFEDYKEALGFYLRLLKIDPTNSNYKYRVGQCYINTPGEKEKAMSYLEDAVRNINPKYKEGKFKEKGAPFDALYYLANAYRINNQIDKALETYLEFKKNLNPAVYDSNVVNLQIQSCVNAKHLMSNPLFIREKNISSAINESTAEFNPVVSDDENILVFARNEAYYDAILYSTRVNGVWSGPLNMNEILKVDNDLFPTSISSDGKTIYLYSSANYDGIIYTSTFSNGSWSPIVKLNENINTRFWESHATISHDNKRLYFTSNRKGTIGGLDIYVSERDSTGDWGPARNLGSVINTPYNEESPFLSQDDKTLFFSSYGHFNMGGYDIFYSTILPDGKMSVPLNVGYPLNSTDDDIFFKPVRSGYEGYFAKESADSYGKLDIYRIEIFSDDHPRKFLVRGLVKVADLLSNFSDSIRVSAMNIKNPEQVLIVYSDPKTGEYEFELAHGNYEISYQGNGTEKISRTVELQLTSPSDSFVLPGTVLPKTDFVADLNVGTNRNIAVMKGDSILFPLKVEPNSILKVEHWADDSLLYTEEFILSDTIFNYKFAPRTGDSKIVFRLTDRFNNTTTTDVFLSREKEQPPVVRPEYSYVIAKKQLEAFTAMLKSRSNEDLKRILNSPSVSKQRFGTVDDVLNYLKDEALKKGISEEEADRVALKVAVSDNVLTQAAVDYLAKNTTGELKKILENLDIYNAHLKTWTDLQQYVAEKTNGRISPEMLNEIAAGVLLGVDPEIALMREKILAYSEHSESGKTIKEVISAVDTKNLKFREKWLEAFYNEAIRRGLTDNIMAEIFAAIGSLPGTTVADFLSALIENADEPLKSVLREIDLKKEKIRSIQDLIAFLLSRQDSTRYPSDKILESIANVIASRDVPVSSIGLQPTGKNRFPWWLLIIAAGIIIGPVVYFRRKNKPAR